MEPASVANLEKRLTFSTAGSGALPASMAPMPVPEAGERGGCGKNKDSGGGGQQRGEASPDVGAEGLKRHEDHYNQLEACTERCCT